MTVIHIDTWQDVCAADELLPGRGVCALVGGIQVALFRIPDADEVVAISNYDPFSGAHVLSRGLLGSVGGITKVASPIYKQSFDVRTGACLDDPTVSVATFPVRVVNGRVEVGGR